MTTTYHDWTAQQIEDWVLDAALTARRLPGRYGPRGMGNCHPPIVLENWKDEKTEAGLIYISRPTGNAIARAETAWAWINALPDQRDRDILYGWSAYMCSNKREFDAKERSTPDDVARVCQRIADSLNRNCAIRLTVPVDEVLEIGESVHDISVASRNCERSPTAVLAFDAKPRPHNSEDPKEVEATSAYIQRVSRRRRNASRRLQAKRKQAERKAA